MALILPVTSPPPVLKTSSPPPLQLLIFPRTFRLPIRILGRRRIALWAARPCALTYKHIAVLLEEEHLRWPPPPPPPLKRAVARGASSDGPRPSFGFPRTRFERKREKYKKRMDMMRGRFLHRSISGKGTVAETVLERKGGEGDGGCARTRSDVSLLLLRPPPALCQNGGSDAIAEERPFQQRHLLSSYRVHSFS